MATIKLIIPLVLACMIGLIGCVTSSKPVDYISAFKPIVIEQTPEHYNSNVNQIVIKNVSFGVFGAKLVTVTLKNVPGHVQGSIEFKLDHPLQPPMSTVQLSALKDEQSKNYFNVTSQTKSKGGLHDLYVSLPPGLHPSNVESILYAPVQYPNEDQWYYVVSSSLNLPMAVKHESGGENLMYWRSDNSIWTQFAFEKVRDKVYKIVSRANGEVITVPDNSKEEVYIMTDVFKNEDGQLWRIIPTVYDTVYFQPLHDNTKRISAINGYETINTLLISSSRYATSYYLVPICSD